MTTHPRIGSIWAVRFPGEPQHDYDFRVTGVFTKDGVTYVEEERLGSGGLRRGRLEDILAYAEPVSDEALRGVDTADTCSLKPHNDTAD
ncbi:hypothetical protein ABZS95_43360 [Streptomyces sp. NPDC005479]|uniref:hypothetical protein n=1 Tax=unclassified Streptomyces TaxID=2593676 RepID=UPI0033BB0C84